MMAQHFQRIWRKICMIVEFLDARMYTYCGIKRRMNPYIFVATLCLFLLPAFAPAHAQVDSIDIAWSFDTGG
jgi:hypothetical protein